MFPTMKRPMYESMMRKYLLSLFFAFGLMFDANCALRFTLGGVPHFITTGKHVSVKWPAEIEKIKDKGNLLLQMAQSEKKVSAEEIGDCIREIDTVITNMLSEKKFNTLKMNDKLVIGHLCNLKDKLGLLLPKNGSNLE